MCTEEHPVGFPVKEQSQQAAGQKNERPGEQRFGEVRRVAIDFLWDGKGRLAKEL